MGAAFFATFYTGTQMTWSRGVNNSIRAVHFCSGQREGHEHFLSSNLYGGSNFVFNPIKILNKLWDAKTTPEIEVKFGTQKLEEITKNVY